MRRLSSPETTARIVLETPDPALCAGAGRRVQDSTRGVAPGGLHGSRKRPHVVAGGSPAPTARAAPMTGADRAATPNTPTREIWERSFPDFQTPQPRNPGTTISRFWRPPPQNLGTTIPRNLETTVPKIWRRPFPDSTTPQPGKSRDSRTQIPSDPVAIQNQPITPTLHSGVPRHARRIADHAGYSMATARALRGTPFIPLKPHPPPSAVPRKRGLPSCSGRSASGFLGSCKLSEPADPL